MLVETLKRLTSGPRPIALLFALILTSLYLMSGATQNSVLFGRLYSLLLAINILAAILLLTFIGRHLLQLVMHYRQRTPGSRLTTRLVIMFVLLSVIPVSILYYFSVGFLERGIDSWFDVRVEQALNDSLEMGRTALDGRIRERLRQTRNYGDALTSRQESELTFLINDLRERSEATEITVLTIKGKVLSSSSIDPSNIVPVIPGSAILLQLQQGNDYAVLEPGSEGHLSIRIATRITRNDPTADDWVLHAIYPVPERMAALAENIQDAFGHYKELVFLREPLKYSFTLTLSLVLMLSALTAVWAAFFAARRLVAPIGDLVEGTRAVAAGDYDKRLPLPGRDELGFLVRSFNEMTRKIALARDDAQRSQRHAEEQSTYLEAVLGHLTSGVITFDGENILRTSNPMADQILGVSLAEAHGLTLDAIAQQMPSLVPLIDALQPALSSGGEWNSEVVLFGARGRQILMCRGSDLPAVADIERGHVVVFDDFTSQIQAQRDAAWAEVARRLAHEIKNPLTPIQLSAERLRRRYLATLSPEDGELLDRSTHTIVQQVDALKTMVKTFSDYAHPPKLEMAELDLNDFIRDVVELYRGDRKIHIQLHLEDSLPGVAVDAGRLRQVLHNLIKNALEAVDEEVNIDIHSRCSRKQGCQFVELELCDDGPGIPDDMLGRIFEPYVTSKPKGSGLGLAIVKKIIEEHGGMLMVENRADHAGACILIRLPVTAIDTPVTPNDN